MINFNETELYHLHGALLCRVQKIDELLSMFVVGKDDVLIEVYTYELNEIDKLINKVKSHRQLFLHEQH